MFGYTWIKQSEVNRLRDETILRKCLQNELINLKSKIQDLEEDLDHYKGIHTEISKWLTNRPWL